MLFFRKPNDHWHAKLIALNPKIGLTREQVERYLEAKRIPDFLLKDDEIDVDYQNGKVQAVRIKK